ncbi:hypothetical protein ECSTECEH250_1262 [Escherichia coli STEC_EH250]|jgi:hypothetical protein|nr:hypothetical protein ECSTECEH250_1262 [Escherichia coli STEC_EH250]
MGVFSHILRNSIPERIALLLPARIHHFVISRYSSVFDMRHITPGNQPVKIFY